MVLEAISIVLSIFLLIGLGMLLNLVGWIKREHMPLISRLVVKVGLPGMIISKLFTQYTSQTLIDSAAGILAPAISLLLTGLIGYGVAHLAKIPGGRRGAFTCMFTFSNAVFIGLPVSMALFGDAVVPYTLLYYIANTVLFWSAGYSLLQKDGVDVEGRRGQAPALQGNGAARWRRMLPMQLVVFLGCAGLVLLGVRLPKFVLDAAGYVSGLVTPLSLIYTGLLIMDMLRGGQFRWQKGYGFMLAGRFLIAPLLLFGVGLLIPMPGLMRNALLVQAAMPVMAQTPIVCAECGSDAEYAAGGIAVSTALSLLAIPAIMAVMPWIG